MIAFVYGACAPLRLHGRDSCEFLCGVIPFIKFGPNPSLCQSYLRFFYSAGDRFNREQVFLTYE